MKKLLYFSLISLIVACAQNELTTKFTINATIKGLTDSKVYLKKYAKSGFMVVDSTTSKNGIIQFEGEVGLPELYRIYLDTQDFVIPVFIENTTITITSDITNSESAKIKGSVSDSLLKNLYGQLNNIDSVNKPLYNAYKAASEKSDKKLMKELDVKLSEVASQQQSAMKTFIKEHKNSTVSAFILYKYLSGELGYHELDSLKKSLDGSLEKSVYIGFLNEQLGILRKIQVGQPAIDFTMPDPIGKSIKLSSLYGKYLLIDFWASWCPNCRDENPELVKFFNEPHPNGFLILGVSFDTKRDNWLKAIHQDNLTWLHVSDLQGWGNAAGEIYGIRAIPSNILLNPQGIIIGKNLSIEEMRKKIAI